MKEILLILQVLIIIVLAIALECLVSVTLKSRNRRYLAHIPLLLDNIKTDVLYGRWSEAAVKTERTKLLIKKFRHRIAYRKINRFNDSLNLLKANLKGCDKHAALQELFVLKSLWRD